MRKPLIAAMAVVSLVLSGCSGQPATTPVPPSETPGTIPSQPPANQTPPPEPVKPPEPPKPVKREAPHPVRGIHFSGWYAGSPDLAGDLLKWAKGAGLNTLVLDIKAEDGNISWESDIPMAREIGSNMRKIGDIEKAIKEYHDMGFWVVGRIVVFNDKYLYRAHREWTIPGFNGGDYSFMDPAKDGVYEYNMAIARAAVKAGVDEIQWDYIRYPYNKEAQPFMDAHTTKESRIEAINGFLRKSVKELHEQGVKVSADVFGLTTSVEMGDDMKIGQDYKSIAEIVDYISPMAYPSHYAAGTYGIANPNASPYETVKGSMAKALERSNGIPLEKHRPWLQDFSIHGVSYGPDQVVAQIKAVNELGIQSWLLWDPSNKYNRSLDFNKLKFEPVAQPATPPAANPQAPSTNKNN